MPPGRLSAATCSSCQDTVLAGVIRLGDWPHDLIHQLATQLESAIEIVTESLTIDTDPLVVDKVVEHRAVCALDLADCVRDFVSTEVESWSADLLDVLSECVTPRLDEWIAAESFSVTPHLRG